MRPLGVGSSLCPPLRDLQTKHGKADLTIYKKAGNAVVAILKARAAACEKRSVDEVAIDVTPEADRLLSAEGPQVMKPQRCCRSTRKYEGCYPCNYDRS